LKRILAIAALAAIVATPALGNAAVKKPKRVERKVTVAYTGFCQAGIDGANGGISGCPNELEDMAKTGEAYVKFFATDTTGQKIGLVSYDPADYATTAASHCGGITKAQKIKAKKGIGLKTVADPTCASVPTTGTLTIVFSNLP
jgi:hypothetical protein